MSRTFRIGCWRAGLLLTAWLASAGLASAAAAQSQLIESPTIAVIDMQKIMRDSKAVQSIQRQIEEQRSAYQATLTKKEEELRAANEELTRQRTVLSGEAYQKKRRELEQQYSSLQREVQQSKRQLDQNYSEAMQQVQQKVIEIVRDIATDRKADIVISKAAMVLVRPELEITDTALKRLNESLTSVKVPSLQKAGDSSTQN